MSSIPKWMKSIISVKITDVHQPAVRFPWMIIDGEVRNPWIMVEKTACSRCGRGSCNPHIVCRECFYKIAALENNEAEPEMEIR